MTQQYQTFSDTPGASNSEEKLKALRIPDLTGRSFLDIGCNEGFFCAHAKQSGATTVVGIDNDPGYIEKARVRNPDIRFQVFDWNNLSEIKETFDVILFSSTLHYAQYPVKLFQDIANLLKPDGVLILECGLANPDPIFPAGIQHQYRHDGIRVYPTYETLKKWMKPFSLRWIGESVMQAGDTFTRYVIHAKKKKTDLYLIQGNPGSGKTNFTDYIKKSADVVIYTDTLPELQDCPNIMQDWDTKQIDHVKIQEILTNLVSVHKGLDMVVLEGYILKDIQFTDPAFNVKRINL